MSNIVALPARRMAVAIGYIEVIGRENSAMGKSLCEVVLISGFLGAGKTTLMRNILSWPGDLSGTAILVNEFGRIGIDGQLLEGFGSPVVEMVNGCICCTLQADLIKTVRDILDRFHPSRLLIEATGVADPIDILKTLNQPQFQNELKVTKVVTVIDADFWEAKENFGPLFYNQVRVADLVLLNKVDLQLPEMVSRFLSEIQETSPSSSVVPTHHCQVDPEVLWKPRSPQVFKVDPFFKTLHGPHQDSQDRAKFGFVTFSFESEAPFQEECFRELVTSLPVHVYRIKGYVLFRDKRVFLNHVGGKTEWIDADEKGNTNLAFVGWQVDEQLVVDRMQRCIEQ